MTSWTEDSYITTSWREDTITSEWGSHFNEIEEKFNFICLKFNEIPTTVTFSEDGDISTSITEDSISATTFSEDTYISTTWSED